MTARAGRPAIGGHISTAVGDGLLAEIDAHAERAGVTRAEAIRRLLAAGLHAGQRPDMPVIVWLSADGMGKTTYHRFDAGCAARGWRTIRGGRSVPWHLAAGGCDVLYIGLGDEDVSIVVVESRWGNPGDEHPMRMRAATGGRMGCKPTRLDPDAINVMGRPGAIVVDTAEILAAADEVLAAYRERRRGPTSATPHPVDEL